MDDWLTRIAQGDPVALGLTAAALAGLLALVLLFVAIARTGRSARTTELLAHELRRMNGDMAQLGTGQTQLSGALQAVSDTAAKTQLQVLHTVEARLSEVQRQMGERLHDTTLKQARSMSELQERMNDLSAFRSHP